MALKYMAQVGPGTFGGGAGKAAKPKMASHFDADAIVEVIQKPKQKPSSATNAKGTDIGKLRRKRAQAKREQAKPEITPISESMLGTRNAYDFGRQFKDQQQKQKPGQSPGPRRPGSMPGRSHWGGGGTGISQSQEQGGHEEMPDQISKEEENKTKRGLTKDRALAKKQASAPHKRITRISGKLLSFLINNFLIDSMIGSIAAMTEVVGFATYFGCLLALNAIMFRMAELAKNFIIDLGTMNPINVLMPGPLKTIFDKNLQLIHDTKLGMSAWSMLVTIFFDIITIFAIVLIIFIMLLPILIPLLAWSYGLDKLGILNIF